MPRPPLSPTAADAAAGRTGPRERIVAAGRRWFLAHGIRSVTMDDLAGELGMSKKTLYAHFPGKAELVEAILLEKFRALEEEVSEIADDAGADFGAGLERLLACIERHASEVRPPFLRDLSRDFPEKFAIVERRRAEVIETPIARLLAAGRRQGRIRKDIPVRVVIAILLGATNAVVNPPRLAELGLTPASAFGHILGALLGGILTPDARTRR